MVDFIYFFNEELITLLLILMLNCQGIVIKSVGDKQSSVDSLKIKSFETSGSDTNFETEFSTTTHSNINKKSLPKREYNDEYITDVPIQSPKYQFREDDEDTDQKYPGALPFFTLNHSPNFSKSNNPELLPLNPYISLLLSHYGRYVPIKRFRGFGLYGYLAANNYHNNKPFGSYKVYENP